MGSRPTGPRPGQDYLDTSTGHRLRFTGERWRRVRPRRFCIWGGNARWTWIGSIEDRFYVRRERERIRRERPWMELGRAARVLLRAAEDANRRVARLALAFGRAYDKQMQAAAREMFGVR